MHRTLRAALATVALLALPQISVAGPIQWEYWANFRTDGDGPLRLDAAVGPPDGSTIVATHLRGEFLDGGGSGSLLVRLGSLLDIDVATAGPTAPPGRAQWLSDLNITDLASGESAMVTVGGRGVYLGDALLLDRRVMLELTDGSAAGRREVILGENRYTIQFRTLQGDDNRISYFEADVTVAPVATPEPGTFALAALGLCAAGAVRRARKGAPA